MNHAAGPPTVLCGLSTAVPAGVMSQTQITELSIDRCGIRRQHADRSPVGAVLDARNGSLNAAAEDRAQIVQMRRLFRNASVSTRHLVVARAPGHAGSDEYSFFPPPVHPHDRGPTTAARMARYESDVTALAAGAAARSIGSTGLEPRQVTHLVTVSCTGFSAPGVDIQLMDQLGLPPTVARTHIGFMGCHGLLIGMRSVDAIIRADPGARVLLCAVELCSLHFQYSHAIETLVANALFADGATAMIAAPAGAVAKAPDDWRIIATGSLFIPDTVDAMTWRIGDHGFEMQLSPDVPQTIARSMTPWLVHWLACSGLAINDIGSWAVHPGGPKVLDAVQEALQLPPEALSASRHVLDGYGNMSSATIGFILQQLAARRQPRPCVSLAFGPGLTIEAALLQ